MGKYETRGGIATTGETLAKLIELLTQAQEQAYVMSHLTKAQGSQKDKALGDGWIAVGEMLKRINYQVIQIGQGKLQ
jgi:hypothetical protein